MKQKMPAISHRALGIFLHLGLFIFYFSRGVPLARPALIPVLLLLGASILLDSSFRMGGSLRRVRCFLRDRLSGSPALALLVGIYLLCDVMNLSYSPMKGEMLEQYPVILAGLLMGVGMLYYVEGMDQLDNLLVNIAGCGLALTLPTFAGYRGVDAMPAMRVILVGLVTGGVFFLYAQYHVRFKATVLTALGGVMLPACGRLYSWAQPSALALLVSSPDRQENARTCIDTLREFGASELLLGRGSGYDLALGNAGGGQNFLLADLMNGGILRFSLALAVWLCIGYCLCMLFLYSRGIPILYLFAFGMVFLEAFLLGGEGFLSNPIFLPYTGLLILEHTMLKKGRQRLQE